MIKNQYISILLCFSVFSCSAFTHRKRTCIKPIKPTNYDFAQAVNLTAENIGDIIYYNEAKYSIRTVERIENQITVLAVNGGIFSDDQIQINVKKTISEQGQACCDCTAIMCRKAKLVPIAIFYTVYFAVVFAIFS